MSIRKSPSIVGDLASRISALKNQRENIILKQFPAGICAEETAYMPVAQGMDVRGFTIRSTDPVDSEVMKEPQLRQLVPVV